MNIRYLIALLGAFLVSCGGEPAVTIAFEGRVGTERFVCGRAYPGVGSTSTTLTVGDLRFYVHAVELLTIDGAAIPLELDEDGMWQHAGVALLDLEEGDGCEMGNVLFNSELRGVARIPEGTRLDGVRFVLGVPFELNHDDVSSAPPPLSYSSLFWGWNGGYKFLRIEGRTTGQPAGVAYHLGSTGCDGDGRGSVMGCDRPNRAIIELRGSDPREGIVIADLASLFAEIDLDSDTGGAAGCLAGATDPDCAAFYEALGLPRDAGGPVTAPQRFFRLESR